MKNEEVIASLREHAKEKSVCSKCICYDAEKRGYKTCSEELAILAAYALEKDEERIAKLEADLMCGTVSEIDRFKINGYGVKDLILFADMCKRNDVREADLKQAAWNLELAVRAYAHEREEIIKNTMNEIVARFTPDFEKAYKEMMPNCGAKMRTVTECHTLESDR